MTMEFTFESKNTGFVLETYEWDNVWIEQANDLETKRVLYIGDSISCGTRSWGTVCSDKKFFFDGFGTSKAVDNPYFEASIDLFAQQERYCNAVLFNNGLHGWHLSDEGGYKEYYEKMIQFLCKRFENIPIFLLLTTSIADDAKDLRVVARNKVVSELADKYNLPVIDLYSVVKSNPQLISQDGVHLVSDGYSMLAKKILDSLESI